MNRAARLLVAVLITLLAAACGDDGNGSNNGGGNNGGADAGNNGTSDDAGGNDGGGNNGQGLTTTGDTCGGTGFTACGGELTGTWVLTGGCVNPVTLPYYSECSADIAVSVSPAGQMTVADDGSYTVDGFLFDAELDATVPKTCLDSGDSCTDNPIDDEGVDAGDACELNYGHDVWLRDPGSLTVDESANTIALTTENGGNAGSFEYCVDGDTLTLYRVNEMHEAQLVLTKQ